MFTLQLLSVLFFGLAMAGAYPCCCYTGITPTCSCCQTGTMPQQYRVAITGVTEGTCGACNDWNASFDMEFVSNCYYEIAAGPCGDDRLISMDITCGSGFTIFLVRAAENASASPAWYGSFAFVDSVNPSDCSQTRTLPFSISQGTLTCDYSGGSVELEAL